MIEAPKRRWFRFSLKTGLVLLTILCVVLGWVGVQLKWIRDRHVFRAEQLSSAQSGHGIDVQDADKMIAEGWPIAYHKQPPGMLGLFGEYGLEFLYVSVPRNDTRKTGDSSYSMSANYPAIRAATRLFPEAEVRAYWWDDETSTSHSVTIEP